MGVHTWNVTFAFDGNLKTVNSRLVVVVPVDSEIPLDEEIRSNSKDVSCHDRSFDALTDEFCFPIRLTMIIQ